jgi:NTP pyrophosphatase (non-canonical NTP hydrolase)
LALRTAAYPADFALIYPVLGLAGEAGELANKVKKLLRDAGWSPGQPLPEPASGELADELGDCLWYVAAVCQDLGLSLEVLMRANLEKLRGRSRRGTLKGSGDQR